MWRLLRAATALVALVAIAASCSSATSTATGERVALLEEGQVQRDDPAARGAPNDVAASTSPVAELTTEDEIVGDGLYVDRDQRVSLHLAGYRAADTSQPFQTTWGASPITFVLGRGEVPVGLDRGIEGMRVGGRRVVRIPAQFGFGAEGSTELAIEPNTDLVYVVDLVGVDFPTSSVDEPVVDLPAALSGELNGRELAVGEGAEAVVGSSVAINYVAVAFSTGEVFDSSWRAGYPLRFTIGANEALDGLDAGVVGMREGGRRLLEVPPEFAYGSLGIGSVGPDETIFYLVDLIEVG